MNQEKIIQAIADVINKKGTDDFGMLPWCKPSDLIAELAAAIAPHLEAGAGWEDAPSWANFKTTNYEGDTTYWEFRPDCTLLGFWVHGEKYGRIEVRELKRGHLEERPR